MITEDDKQKYQSMNQEQLNQTFNYACSQGELNLIQYLLTSPDLKEHADIHDQNDRGFLWACWQQHSNIIDYLVIEQNMTISEELNQDLKKENNKVSRYVLKLIEARDLNNNMNDYLTQKPVKSKKVKL